jgi:hypothetical protein
MVPPPLAPPGPPGGVFLCAGAAGDDPTGRGRRNECLAEMDAYMHLILHRESNG